MVYTIFSSEDDGSTTVLDTSDTTMQSSDPNSSESSSSSSPADDEQRQRKDYFNYLEEKQAKLRREIEEGPVRRAFESRHPSRQSFIGELLSHQHRKRTYTCYCLSTLLENMSSGHFCPVWLPKPEG